MLRYNFGTVTELADRRGVFKKMVFKWICIVTALGFQVVYYISMAAVEEGVFINPRNAHKWVLHSKFDKAQGVDKKGGVSSSAMEIMQAYLMDGESEAPIKKRGVEDLSTVAKDFSCCVEKVTAATGAPVAGSMGCPNSSSFPLGTGQITGGNRSSGLGEKGENGREQVSLSSPSKMEAGSLFTFGANGGEGREQRGVPCNRQVARMEVTSSKQGVKRGWDQAKMLDFFVKSGGQKE
eukprot:TRINITY_DN3743_c0_g1_i1.p2 TRINITY_DN3743_c0_g1~~TRINITY_DN3743_c0_g1_i1.p2  ORF type:complete len:237 (-),score=36.27 TRINITY_DN3743_c0_g1_i1:900-1610(-)